MRPLILALLLAATASAQNPYGNALGWGYDPAPMRVSTPYYYGPAYGYSYGRGYGWGTRCRAGVIESHTYGTAAYELRLLREDLEWGAIRRSAPTP